MCIHRRPDPVHRVEGLIYITHRQKADKLHYLKRYVGGPARRILDGIFYRNDEEAYKDAWSRLSQRYGHPFVIQKAFREKLSNWPKIHTKDAEG